MEACVFCEIVAGRTPASVVHDDASSLAFMDIRPVTPGHLLVVPKRHAAFLAELDEETGAHLFRVGMRRAAALRRSGLRCEGVNLFLADGEAAGQEVFHAHLHVFPRFQGDAFRLDADWSNAPDRAELDRIAHRLRDAVARENRLPQRHGGATTAPRRRGLQPRGARGRPPPVPPRTPWHVLCTLGRVDA